MLAKFTTSCFTTQINTRKLAILQTLLDEWLVEILRFDSNYDLEDEFNPAETTDN
jgi:hypothetical protein